MKTLRMAALVAAFCFVTVSVFGRDDALLFANSEQGLSSWSTTLVLSNPTDDPVAVPGFWSIYVVGGPIPVIPAHSTSRFPSWPYGNGFPVPTDPRFAMPGGVVTLPVPDEIEAYTEITNPSGRLFRIGPLREPIVFGQKVEFLDLKADGEFLTTVALAAAADDFAAARIEAYGVDGLIGFIDDWVLSSGLILLTAPQGTTRIVMTHGSRVGPAPRGPFYAAVLISAVSSGDVVMMPTGHVSWLKRRSVRRQ